MTMYPSRCRAIMSEEFLPPMEFVMEQDQELEQATHRLIDAVQGDV